MLPTAALTSSEELHRTTVKWIKFWKYYMILEKTSLFLQSVLNSVADELVHCSCFVQLQTVII